MSVSQVAQRRIYLPNIGHWTLAKMWIGTVSYTERTAHGNDFELIPMVKMETRLSHGRRRQIIW